MVERTCLTGGVYRVERRYFINAIPAAVASFVQAIRGHWGVENRLHWCLDVFFREDASRRRS